MPGLDELETLEGYRHSFMDAGLWRPYVREVCHRHALIPCALIRPGLAGTYPTFVVGERWVVKFFGRLFDGELCFETERLMVDLLKSQQDIPSPTLIASGHLSPEAVGWRWPYLIFEFIPGISIGKVYGQVSIEARLRLARELGDYTRRLHSLAIPEGSIFSRTWESYRNFLEKQRANCAQAQQSWGTLPPRLVEQIDAYLLPVGELVDLSLPAHLIHADLTRDHILGRVDGDRWVTLGIIDYGDAIVGNLYYELVALHLDLFDCDKRLLRAYLEAYGLRAAQYASLPARAMSLTLLHCFDVLVGVFGNRRTQIDQFETLEQLAAALWDLDAPGLDS